MRTIAQLEIDGRILALIGGYVWDLGLFDDGVVHGGVGTCTPQHWSKRHSTHVRRFVVATKTMINNLDAFNMRHNTPRMGFKMTRAFLECSAACLGHKSRFTRMDHSANAWDVIAPFSTALYESMPALTFMRK